MKHHLTAALGFLLVTPFIIAQEKSAPFRAEANYLVKGQVEIFLNGKPLKVENVSDNDEMQHGTSVKSSKIQTGDKVVIRLRSDAVHRGLALSFVEETGPRVVSFKPADFRVVEEADPKKANQLINAKFMRQNTTTPEIAKPDPFMSSIWRTSYTGESLFLKPSVKSEWETWVTMITPEMISSN